MIENGSFSFFTAKFVAIMWNLFDGIIDGNLFSIWTKLAWILDIGGEDGIRTHVPGYPDQLISSQRRCDRFGTSPLYWKRSNNLWLTRVGIIEHVL